MKRKNNFPALILFLCGFLAGNLLPNVLWKIKWQQKTMASVYFLSTFTTGQITGTEYLKEILKYRGSLFLVSAICGLGLLLPQYLFYIPAYLYLMRQVWEMSAGIWRNKGLFPERIGVYLLRSSAACGIYLIGILAECCLNPWIVEKLLSYIKIF